MIKKLYQKDRHIIENIKDIDSSIIRIKAVLKAYGMGLNFVSFYANDTGEIVICVQDNLAVVYLKDATHIDEVSDFLMITGHSVLSEYPLKLEGYKVETGNIYQKDSFINTKLDDISTDIKTAYHVLSKVFSSINSTSYKRWYTDLSHRIRHNMSKVYTLDGQASITSYCKVDNTMMVTQLGTLESARGKGYATALINHAATDNMPIDKIILLSQDENSDRFYEKIGFKAVKQYFYYKK